jgi:hypothetical protein
MKRPGFRISFTGADVARLKLSSAAGFHCVHRFMATLTEAVHEAQGRTVLYMPAEELNSCSIAEAARDKHLTQRLETTLIYWTRQITNVLNQQSDSNGMQQEGPLAEIAFWRSRSLDLSGIKLQLENKQVRCLQQYRHLQLMCFTYCYKV